MITNEFLELGVGNLVRRHSGMEVVCFTIIFCGNTATYSEIYNKNLEHLEQKRGHILKISFTTDELLFVRTPGL